MNIRQFEILRAVVDAGSASRAAQALGLSQPAVSRNMQQLEAELGLRLFDRSRGRLSPTPEAMRLHAEIEKAFIGIEQAVNSARDISNLVAGRLRLAAVPSLSQGLLREVIGLFLKQSPSLNVSFEVRSNRSVIDLISSRSCDMGLGTLPVSHPGVVAETVCRPPACCVVPERHALASEPCIEAEMLHGVDFITMSRRHNSRHRLDEIFQAAGVLPRVRMDVATAETAVSMAKEGIGLAVVNALTARYHHGQGVLVKPFIPEMQYNFGLMFPVKQPQSEVTQKFSQFLRNHLANMDFGDLMPPKTAAGGAL